MNSIARVFFSLVVAVVVAFVMLALIVSEMTACVALAISKHRVELLAAALIGVGIGLALASHPSSEVFR